MQAIETPKLSPGSSTEGNIRSTQLDASGEILGLYKRFYPCMELRAPAIQSEMITPQPAFRTLTRKIERHHRLC